MKPFMSVCRSEGGDASKGIEDTVMTDAGGSAPLPVGSASEELRETLGKNTRTDLMEECRAAGISGYSNKRKEELIDLLVRKKLRPLTSDEQVQYQKKMRLCIVRRGVLCLDLQYRIPQSTLQYVASVVLRPPLAHMHQSSTCTQGAIAFSRKVVWVQQCSP